MLFPTSSTASFASPDVVYVNGKMLTVDDHFSIAGGLRFRRDAEGRRLKTRPCYADERTDHQDDCLAEAKERAWSSPIYFLRAGGG